MIRTCNMLSKVDGMKKKQEVSEERECDNVRWEGKYVHGEVPRRKEYSDLSHGSGEHVLKELPKGREHKGPITPAYKHWFDIKIVLRMVKNELHASKS